MTATQNAQDHETPELVTSGKIANDLGVKKYRVDHVIDRDEIKPVQVAGGIRLFSQDVIKLIKEGLARTRSREAPAA